MAIFDFFETVEEKKELSSQQEPPVVEEAACMRDRFFSAMTARLFFFLLFLGDFCWGAYASVLFLFNLIAAVATFFRVPLFRRGIASYWISLKRALVCGMSLIVALFSPAFGIMIACTYFLMYDKVGFEEVVPSSLQSQVKDFFKTS